MRTSTCPIIRRPGIAAALVALVALVGATTARGATAQEPPVATDTATAPDGVPIAYEVHGTGPTALVLVHGWSCDRSYWAHQMEPFAGEFTVVAIDLAGHGESGTARRDWTMAAFGGDVAAVVEKLGLQRVVLVGHSMGGDVIAEAARRLPGRVAGLVWVDVYRELGAGRPPEQVAAFLAPFRADFAGRTRDFVHGMFLPGADPALVERVAADMAAAPPEIAIAALESALSYSRQMPRTLGELKLPVVAINADFVPTDVASLERHGVRVTTMSGVGHFLQLDDPARFNRLLRTALDSLAR